MTKYRYKNTSDQDLTLVGIGVVAAGETIESDDLLISPNLEAVTDTKTAKSKVSKEDGDGE